MLELWGSLEPVHDQVLGLAFTLLGTTILYLFRARVKLIYGRANNSLNHVSLPNPEGQATVNSLEVCTEKFYLQNLGRQPATDVEFILSDFPTDINVWEPRDVEYKRVAKSNCMVRIPKIAPGELVIIDCVYLNMRAAYVTSVKCSESLGKEVPFQTIRRYPNAFNMTIVALVLLGIAFVFQFVIAVLGAGWH